MTKKNKTILIVALVIGAAIAVTLAVRHYSKPDFTKMSPRQIRQYFDSNEFRDANEDQKRAVREQMGEAMMARMEAQANEYSALSPDQKTVYLDKIIDEMEARRAEFMAREANDVNRPPDVNGPPDPNGPRRFGQRGRNMGQRQVNPERRRERSSRMSADTKVKMDQFRQDMQNRMQQRGMGGGGGRGGFGGGGPGGGGPP